MELWNKPATIKTMANLTYLFSNNNGNPKYKIESAIVDRKLFIETLKRDRATYKKALTRQLPEYLMINLVRDTW